MRMKKVIFLSVFCLLATVASYAQNYAVVNTEKIFKTVPDYLTAMSTLDKLSQQYQKNIDDAYASIEKMYNDYQAQKPHLTESARQTREDAIISKEKEVGKYQQDIFGPQGELMKKRMELIKPVQDMVFSVINQYAQSNGLDMVIDVATNPSLLYYSPKMDKTEEIISQIQKAQTNKNNQQ